MSFFDDCKKIYMNVAEPKFRRDVAKNVEGMYLFNTEYRAGMEAMTAEKIVSAIENGAFIQDLIETFKDSGKNMTDKYYDIYFDRDVLQVDEGGKEQTLYGL